MARSTIDELTHWLGVVTEQEREWVQAEHVFARGYYAGYRQALEHAIDTIGREE